MSLVLSLGKYLRMNFSCFGVLMPTQKTSGLQAFDLRNEFLHFLLR